MIEVIARAIVIKDGKILLCKSNEQGHYFLPGGHVEFGESAEVALKREMREESNTDLINIKFVGIFENTFGEEKEKHHEVNIIHTASVSTEEVSSLEDHISFQRIEVEDLLNVKFLPSVFAQKIIDFSKDKQTIFLSTLI